ncbi:MAG: tRNA lysidine(34) synthetase TilS [Flavobacterium sp.]|nr:tRNA lysidine(34) synthetase TilS [Flavobacterium sp.]
MIKKFENHLTDNFHFLNGKKLLLATSGGLDSMVMAHLFHKLNFEIAIAHCNFQLRGLESFDDQNFVQEYAIANEIPIFITQFDTENFANDYKFSIQVAARNLRYNWFYELLETKNYDFILTAHHADDSLETFIINLSRGTGLDGLIGIPIQNDKIIRPFLIFSRQELEDYAKGNNIKWRNDCSNASDKYLRNKIRHHVVPHLKDLNPNFLESFQKTQNYLQESQTMVQDATIMIYQQVAKELGENIHFDLLKIKTLPNYTAYLYQWLQEFGFKAWNDIFDLIDAQSGKIIYSNDYQLFKNRNELILSTIYQPENQDSNQFYNIEKNQLEVKFPIKLSICKVLDIYEVSKSTIFVDEDKLVFPLRIKKWNVGDRFQPFGMMGKSKKISKFFKDEKLSLLEKQNIWILTSDSQVVWIIGLRQDERFKVENSTKNKLQISYTP